MSGNREANETEKMHRRETTPVDVRVSVYVLYRKQSVGQQEYEQNYILLLPYEYKERPKQRSQSRNGRREREGGKVKGRGVLSAAVAAKWGIAQKYSVQ